MAKPLRLVGLEAELHTGKGENQLRPVRFRLGFEGAVNITLSINGAGDELILDDRSLTQFDMAEFGRTIVQDVVCLIAPRLQQADISGVIELRAFGRRAGLTLSTEIGAFHIWVDSDEWFWGNDLDLKQHSARNKWDFTFGEDITATIYS
jgi:hypothetical protein